MDSQIQCFLHSPSMLIGRLFSVYTIFHKRLQDRDFSFSAADVGHDVDEEGVLKLL